MKKKTILKCLSSIALAVMLGTTLYQPMSASAQNETGIETATEQGTIEESKEFPFDNPPGSINKDNAQSMWVGDLIYLGSGYSCEAIENEENVEIKAISSGDRYYQSYPYSIRFIKEGTVKIRTYTDKPESEEIYEFNVQPAKEPYVEQLMPSKIKVGDSFRYIYIYHNSLLGDENGFRMSDLTFEESKKYCMRGINWGGAWATDPETRTVEGLLPIGATKPGVFKVAAQRDSDHPYEVTIEEPVIKSNLPKVIEVGTELSVTTSLENTSLVNRKVEDVVEQLTMTGGGYQEGEPRYPIGYQPKMEIVSGAELVERSNPDYTNILNTSETIKFIGEGTVEFKVTYDMHSLYKNNLESDDVFGYLPPSYPIAIREDAMYSPTATFSVNVSSELPSEPTEPDKPDNEGSKLSEEKIQETINYINYSSNGAVISVDMGDVTVVPKEILEAAKGKDVDIKFVMAGYTWTINGKNIFADALQDINLEVKFDTNAVPNDLVNELAGDNPTRQLSLTHNGDFGFRAALTMDAGKEYNGKYGNLYYYNNKNLEFMTSDKIAETGTVNLEFTHASDYVLVMSDTDMEQQNHQSGVQSVQTGDETSALPYVLSIIVCLGIAGMVIKKRYSAK